MKGMLDPTMLAELRRLELRTKRSVSSDLCGRYRSAFRGSGLIFSDIRQYQPGDDPKHIHWKVTARTGTAHSKSFEEDRLLSMLLLVDCSASTGAGLGRSMHARALELAALLTLLARQNGDAVGLGLFSDQMNVYLPPSRKRSQSDVILSELFGMQEAKGSTSLAAALEYVQKRQKARAIIFVVSDFVTPAFQDQLRGIAYRHDVIGIDFADNGFYELGEVGLLQVKDPESGQLMIVDSSSRKFRGRYLEEQLQRRRATKDIFIQSGADFLLIEDSPLRELSRFMEKRVARQR